MTNAIVGYLLAVAAGRYGIAVHAFCVLSNHYHLVVTDPSARLPAFQQLLDALVARALNVVLGRRESFWAPDTYSAVTLVSPEDIVDKTAYVLANPVAAGLVAAGSAWPGLWSTPDSIGGAPLEFARPAGFFDPDGPMPERATLQLTAPPGFASADRFRALLAPSLSSREDKARSARRCRGGFLGVAGVLRQKPTASPAELEPRRTLKPSVAARDKWKRIEALARLVEFLDAYRTAWDARRAGNSRALFPAGTYLLRVLHGAPCASTV
jgi:REP-associated tyrosine transposase